MIIMDKHTLSTPPYLGFYIHHHGSGHVMRAITIASSLTADHICFIGSNLRPYLDQIPEHIVCIHLPLDLPDENDHQPRAHALSFLHYAPLGIAGIRERTAVLTATFRQYYPMLLVVDVSVEVTLLARLSGIPTVVVRQHGKRTDIPHLDAYESAELLIAPYAETFALTDEEEWIKEKTVYAGGFSKYSDNKTVGNEQEQPGHIAILVGQGGTSLDTEFIHHLATACENYIFHIMGSSANHSMLLKHNLTVHGQLKDPKAVLDQCQVVIGNAGHNTVMEMADLNKRFICIPEDRPFDEQLQKADLLAVKGCARVIYPGDLFAVNWPDELENACSRLPNWDGMINPDALQHIAHAIKNTMNQVFITN